MSPDMINLKCTSCGATLDIPDNLTVAHCVYCGAKILITENDSQKDQMKINNYLAICETALNTANYYDVFEYSNKILEIDSKNVDAWVYKAKATCPSYPTEETDIKKVSEALKILDKALEIAPENLQIMKLKKQKETECAYCFYLLAKGAMDEGAQDFLSEGRTDMDYAKKISAVNYKYAANCLNFANYYDPDNMHYLFLIQQLLRYYWVDFDNIDELREKVKIYETFEKRKEASEKLPEYRNSLKEAEVNLANLKQKKGLFTGGKIKEAEKRIDDLKENIAQYEKIISLNKSPL